MDLQERFCRQHNMESYFKYFFLNIVFFSVLMLGQTELPAAQDPTVSQGGCEIPECIISVSTPGVIAVDKSSQTLFFYNADAACLSLVKQYQCSTGKVRGDKLKRGDRKTPEGVFFVNRVYHDAQLPSKYGAFAFVLDFPNIMDKRMGKGGNGIWIHGLDRTLKPYDSQGCVALRNNDIIDLERIINPLETPVVIAEKIKYQTRASADMQRRSVQLLMDNWRKAWQEKDFDNYCSCYSEKKFKSAKRKWYRWKKQKLSLNEQYKFIDVNLYDINILKHEGTYVVSFFQDYESDRFRSRGFKKVFLKKNSDSLKIVAEDWIKTHSRGSDDNTGVSDRRHVVRFLNKWVNSWEEKKISSYMSCYSRKFKSNNMGWQQWREYKSHVNRENRIIRVSVASPQINIKGDDASVSFVQKYVSDTYTDYGRKKLRLHRESTGWKIISELWESI